MEGTEPEEHPSPREHLNPVGGLDHREIVG